MAADGTALGSISSSSRFTLSKLVVERRCEVSKGELGWLVVERRCEVSKGELGWLVVERRCEVCKGELGWLVVGETSLFTIGSVIGVSVISEVSFWSSAFFGGWEFVKDRVEAEGDAAWLGSIGVEPASSKVSCEQ